MTRPVRDIQNDIRLLDSEEKAELLRNLIADPDGPADPGVERAWLETSQRQEPAAPTPGVGTGNLGLLVGPLRDTA